MSQIAHDSDNLALGAKFLMLRRHLGLTQNAMAQVLGISPRTVQNYERGDREMSATIIKRLHDLYGVDPLWVLSDRSGPPRMRSGKLDSSLLFMVMEEVERCLDRRRLRLSLAKKAELISLIYDHFGEAQRLDPEFVERAVGLAA